VKKDEKERAACAAFLNAYKKLEESLSSSGRSVYDLEKEFGENANRSADEARLRLCRMTRNYLQHRPDVFVVPGDEMVSFLERILLETNGVRPKVKDVLKKKKALKSTDDLLSVAKSLTRAKEEMPVTDENGVLLGMLDSQALVALIAKNGDLTKPLGTTALTAPNKIISPNTYADAEPDAAIVTDTGKEKGKYKGIYVPETTL